MLKKILFFTGSRADYGILKPLIYKTKLKKLYKVELAAAGQHFSKYFGYTYNQIIKDGFKINFKSKTKIENTNFKNIINYLLRYFKSLASVICVYLNIFFS